MIINFDPTNKFMNLNEFKTAKERREFLEEKLKIKLGTIAKAFVDSEKTIHCENLIGATTLPLGVTGPISIKNEELRIKNYYIPLATTEGALVASVNRGCKAINLSGGVTTSVENVGTTRGPVFETSGIKESLIFKNWLNKNFNLLKSKAEKTSSHLRLKKLGTRIVGRYVYVRFYFDTQEAMGMNMATIATDLMTQFIEEKTKIKCLSISGNFCIDKKPAWLNFLSGRGKKVWAEIILKKEVVKQVLKTTPEKFFEVWLAKCMIGSAMSGSLGFNAHFANVVAAFFAATGQDLAHVVEGSMGITTSKVLKNRDLYVSVYLPAVMIGTVGGGTKLKTKQEGLSIIGAKTSIELAEVLGGAVLAGEISLLASLAEGTLSKAHKKLGR
ncbi:MAG TPA: hydroxymethylglutaryl-CoA reductase [Patescibacteria group bacterium]